MGRVIAELRAFPAVSRLGLTAILVAGVVDVVALLLGTGAHGAHRGFVPEHAAHLLGVVGMVLTLAGVLIQGARRQLNRRAAAAVNGGLDSNAPR